MGEKLYDVRIVAVDYTCDTCNDGVMKHTGRSLLTSPPMYIHECTSCGAQKSFRHLYPNLRYERRDEMKQPNTIVCLKALRARSDVDRFYRRQVDYSTGAEITGTFDTRLAELTQQRKKAIRRAQEALKTAPEVEDKGAAQWVHVPGKHTVITVPNRGGTFV